MFLATLPVWLFRVSSLLVALAVLRVLFAPINLVMPDIAYYLPSAGVAAILHIIGGPLALLLAPVQLSGTLRRRYPKMHRWSGYLYGLAILAAGSASLAMLPHFRGALSSAVGFGLLAVLWIGFTAIGILHAMAGRHEAHRRFMLRSVALTFAAVTLRVMMIPLLARGWTSTETHLVTAWASWTINLAFVELVVLRRRPSGGPRLIAP